MDEDLENYKFSRGANWTEENIRTLVSWLHTSAVMLDLTREATTYYRKLMRRSTIINLVFSSVAGTVSLSQFNGSSNESYQTADTLLKAFFSAASILVALNTGYIKVYQIQERLESTIQLQQQWSNFGSLITSELQLPIPLRKDALQIITKMKETYHHLIRDHVDINRAIIEKVAIRNGISPQQLTITDLFERVIVEEMSRVRAERGALGLGLEQGKRIKGEEDSIIDVGLEEGLATFNTDDAMSVESNMQSHEKLKHMQRTSSRFFENKNSKKLRKLEKKAMNTRAQVANMVLSPGPRVPVPTRTTYNNVMSELKGKKHNTSSTTTYESDSSDNRSEELSAMSKNITSTISHESE